MTKTYRVFVQGEEHIDIDANSFEIEDGGTLVFYSYDDTNLTTGQQPFTAYSEWASVIEK